MSSKDVITRLARLRYLRIAGFAAGAVAVAGAAVFVTASAAGLNVGFRPASAAASRSDSAAVSQTTANASAVCNDFISHLSSDLNTNQAKLNAAIQKAVSETLADEVKNKDLTQAQADAIKKKLGNQAPCTLASGLGNASKPVANPQSAYLQQLESAAASALGVSDTQLKTDLAQGMTLSQIAAAQTPPVTEAQFRSRLIATLTSLLDKAVTNQKLTATQEQAIIKQLQTGTIPLWNTPFHKPTPKAPASPASPA